MIFNAMHMFEVHNLLCSRENNNRSAEDMSLSPNTSCRSNMKAQIVNRSDEELSFLLQDYYKPMNFLKKDYKSTKDMFTTSDITCRSRTKFDLKNDYCRKLTNCEFNNITKTLENLRVNDDNKNDNSKTDLDKVKCRDKLSPSDNKEDVNNNDNVTIKNYCKGKNCLSLNIREEERRCLSPDDLNSSDEETEEEDDDSYDDSDLIEKGPIKPDYQHQRAGPYFFNCQPRNNSVVIPTDYEKTAEQIMRNKDYSDKLNPCLDQLSSMNCQNPLLIRAILPDRIEENGDFRSGDSSGDEFPFTFLNEEMEDEALINFMSKNGYQTAHCQILTSDSGNHSIPSPRSTLSDSPRSYISIVSRSNSRASSRAQSPGSVTNSSGSPQMPLNIIGSPLGSPQITPAYRVPQALLSSSSSNQSSASNQSYSDVSSPLNYQTPQNYQFANFRDILCSGDSSGTINETELELIDEVIKEEELKKLKSQVTPNIPHFPPSYNKLEHERPASNAQNKLIHSIHEIPINNFKTDYANILNTSSGKELNSPNYCMLNNCVPPNLYPNQTCYDTTIKNPQVDVAKYLDITPKIVLNNNGGSVKISEQNSSQKMSQASSNEANQASSSTFVPNNFQAPTTIPSSFTSNRTRRRPTILPWHMLQLPSVSASERLKEVLDPQEVAKAMHCLERVPIERLTATDEDGDTQLMRLLSDTKEFAKNKAFLVPLIEKLKNTPKALEMKNKYGENALLIAALNYPKMSYVCGYLAAVMLHKGIDINQKLDRYGNTLIHCIAAQGDLHGEVLAEMLKLLKGNSAFDISCRNIYGQTALHIAVKEHLIGTANIKALATTRLLLENGADLKVKEIRSGDTALHMAVSLHHDPALVKVLLLNADRTVVNERNYKGNTPLHIAAGFSTAVNLEKQMEICRLLIGAGCLANIQNNEGKTPLALVSLERKDIIKQILHRKL